jgi:ABC-type proline/glycine betaine transport system ATPase subunit
VVHGRVAGKLKRGDTDLEAIDNGNPSAVIPYAQTDAVELFVEGVDPGHAVYATRLMAQTLDRFMRELLQSLEMSDDDRKRTEVEWGEHAKKHWREFSEATKRARIRNYVMPLLDVIAILPKDELAAVAEALVNITSLRRKVSMDAETVGGPIDVAVISKGDGLVWIHRKHYFRSELNPQFLEKYFAH